MGFRRIPSTGAIASAQIRQGAWRTADLSILLAVSRCALSLLSYLAGLASTKTGSASHHRNDHALWNMISDGYGPSSLPLKEWSPDRCRFDLQSGLEALKPPFRVFRADLPAFGGTRSSSREPDWPGASGHARWYWLDGMKQQANPGKSS